MSGSGRPTRRAAVRQRRTLVKRCLSGFIVGGVGLVLWSAGTTRAAEQPPAYTFKPLAALDTPLPGGGMITNDFEIGTLNASGVVAFVADAPDKDVEGAFLVGPDAKLQVVALSGKDAPAGGTIGILVY